MRADPQQQRRLEQLEQCAIELIPVVEKLFARPWSEQTKCELETARNALQSGVERMEALDLSGLDEAQKERAECVSGAKEVIERLDLVLLDRSLDESLKRLQMMARRNVQARRGAMSELVERWGYRDLTERVEQLELEQPGAEACYYLQVLQRPTGKPVVIQHGWQILRAVNRARETGEEYPQGCPAPEPSDEELWATMRNWESDEEEEHCLGWRSMTISVEEFRFLRDRYSVVRYVRSRNGGIALFKRLTGPMTYVEAHYCAERMQRAAEADQGKATP